MNKLQIGLIGLLLVILLGVTLLVFSSKDKEGPVILFLNQNFTYICGNDTTELLYGVIAIDSVDGDVSNTLLIESILPLYENTTARVTYAAKDKKNHITKKSLLINYIADNMTDNTIESDEIILETNLSDITTSEDMEAILTQALEENKLDETTIKTDDEDIDEDKNKNEDEDNDQEQTKADKTDENNKTKDKEEKIIQTEEEEEVSKEIPVIKLNQDEISLPLNSTFNYLNYIESIKDDKDDKDYLYNRIQIEGIYNLKEVGEYTIKYYVTDSDSNKSETAVLKLIVTE